MDRNCPQWFERTNFGGVGNGGNIALRRLAFDVWPGFHQGIGAGTPVFGGEEHYAFFSLVNLDFRVIYTPSAIVHHPFPANFTELRKRYLVNQAASTGYVTMLFFEQPQFRLVVLKYLWEAWQGQARSWRGSPAPHLPIAKWRILLARIEGPTLYLRSRYLSA